jgi:hypothetical protein
MNGIYCDSTALFLVLLTLLVIICDSYITSIAPIQIRPRSINTQQPIQLPQFYAKSLQQHDSSDNNSDEDCVPLQPKLHHPSLLTEQEMIVARQFKIVTCSASSCTAMRKKLSLDEYATFTLLYERLVENKLLHIIPIEETSCLGSCAMAPCVAIEHEDYDGTVALYGMNPSEFQLRTFHQVQHDSDAQRIWEILISSIQTMAATDTAAEDEEVTNNNDAEFDTDVNNHMNYDDDTMDNHPNAV